MSQLDELITNAIKYGISPKELFGLMALRPTPFADKFRKETKKMQEEAEEKYQEYLNKLPAFNNN